MTNPHIVSRHFLRRRARKKERELTAAENTSFDPRVTFGPKRRYRVQRAKRGPYRWLVIAS